MSLSGFQRAMADAVTSPALCRRMRDGDAAVLDGYDLTEKERSRVVAVTGQHGMTVNTTLYFGNRLALLMRTLPLTCRALGQSLPTVAARYWNEAPHALLQFRAEAFRFGAHLRGRITDGELAPILADTVAVDLAVLDLRLSPLADGPRQQVVRVDHDPDAILGNALAGPARRPAGEQWLLVEVDGDRIGFGRVDAATGRRLAAGAPSPAATGVHSGHAVLRLGALTT